MTMLANGSMDLVKAQKAIFGMLKAKNVPAKLAAQQSEDILQDCLVDCLEKDIPLTYGICRIGVKHSMQNVARSKEKKSIFGADQTQAVDSVSRKHSTVGQAILNEAISRLDNDSEVGMIGNMVLNGYKGNEISEIIGLSTATVCRRIEEVRNILDK